MHHEEGYFQHQQDSQTFSQGGQSLPQVQKVHETHVLRQGYNRALGSIMTFSMTTKTLEIGFWVTGSTVGRTGSGD